MNYFASTIVFFVILASFVRINSEKSSTGTGTATAAPQRSREIMISKVIKDETAIYTTESGSVRGTGEQEELDQATQLYEGSTKQIDLKNFTPAEISIHEDQEPISGNDAYDYIMTQTLTLLVIFLVVMTFAGGIFLLLKGCKNKSLQGEWNY